MSFERGFGLLVMITAALAGLWGFLLGLDIWRTG